MPSNAEPDPPRVTPLPTLPDTLPAAASHAHPLATIEPLSPPRRETLAPRAGSFEGDDGDGEREGRRELTTERKVQRPRKFKVILHNDDYTTMEFVVGVLIQFFRRSEIEATHIMLSVHRTGSGVAGVYPRDVAETKVEQVHTHAREHGMPLKLTAEPE